jgi:predicted transcriptional regulator
MARSDHLDVTGKLARIQMESGTTIAPTALKVLSNDTRWRIFNYLGERFVTISQLANDLSLASSTTSRHIALLQEAGLVHTEMRPASRGLEKVVARGFEAILIDLPPGQSAAAHVIEMSSPIGAYTNCEVGPTCGLANSERFIGFQDEPSSFFDPDRISAQLLWFGSGFLEYRFPNRTPVGSTVTAIDLSCEICSEAPNYNADWPSDISVWINDVHIGEWTCPSDFGGRRGHLTPAWWPSNLSQYGLNKRWLVTQDGTSLDGEPLSDVTIDALQLEHQPTIKLRLGIRPEARNVGGINLFGRGFGNYPQDLFVRIEHDE